jgi:hypothetical protein
MKVLSNIVNLSVVATLLLQSGHFVNATPLFNVVPGGNHLNDASLENACDSKYKMSNFNNEQYHLHIINRLENHLPSSHQNW